MNKPDLCKAKDRSKVDIKYIDASADLKPIFKGKKEKRAK